ncbi:sulfotransferase family protein [Streptomyces sp. NPDC091972]|uniref:sulfotransferase family protein n=1 Tax=Streptomyces sp. NPDC091972 TaxID=3366007 RepID=UPI0037F3ACB7
MPFIFVGGSARSGTSLVQKLLVSHSAIAGGPEFDHTGAIVDLYRRMSEPWRLDRQAFYYTAGQLADGFRAFYEGFFTQVTERDPDAAFLSEKTPSNILAAETLLELWPDAVFVNVVRDGRDVVLSHLDVNRRYRARGERNPERDTLLSVCRHWNACISAYFDLMARPDLSERVHHVVFEDLVTRPEDEVRRLFEFLGLKTEERQMHPENITEQEVGVVLEGAYFTQQLYRQPFNAAKTNRWRQEMNPLQKAAATRLMKSNLRRLGYPT